MSSQIIVNKRKLAQVIGAHVKKKITEQRVTVTLKRALFEYIANQIRSSSEYQMLLNDPDVIGDLGTLQIPEVLDQMLEIFKEEEFIKFTFQTARGSGGKEFLLDLDVGLIDTSYSQVLNIPGAEYVSYNTQNVGSDVYDEGVTFSYNIQWLRWLLIDGNVRIDDFQIRRGSNVSGSRTGYAVMRPKIGGHWVLSEPFAGSSRNDNFVTRALNAGIESLKNEIAIQIIDAITGKRPGPSTIKALKKIGKL